MFTLILKKLLTSKVAAGRIRPPCLNRVNQNRRKNESQIHVSSIWFEAPLAFMVATGQECPVVGEQA